MVYTNGEYKRQDIEDKEPSEKVKVYVQGCPLVDGMEMSAR